MATRLKDEEASLPSPAPKAASSFQSWSLFEEPYWLDSVAPDGWEAVEVHEAGALVGRLPFIVKKKAGLSRLTQPLLTPWLGPWIRSNDGKYNKQLSHQHDIQTKLLEQLPKTHSKAIYCAPELSNLMAFHWAGYELGLGYTYRIEDLHDLDAVWSGFRDNIRRECRKAEKKVEVVTEPDVGRLLALVEKTFSRQHRSPGNLRPLFERVEDTMAPRGQSRMYFAVDSERRVHAAIYVVFDERAAFFLAGGGDPELRSSGAHSLLIWHAIKDSAKTSAVFDFEGSMLPPIERFFRSFNARQVPRYAAYKRSYLFSILEASRARFTSR